MEGHPDFIRRPLPERAVFDGFMLERLTPAVVEEDFRAVTQSAPVLRGLFGDDWPEGLTLAQNGADLARHAREFAACLAFAWVIRSEDGSYLGCAYLNPEPGVRGRGTVVTWIVAREDRLDLLAAFNSAFAAWLSERLPPGFALTWMSNDRLP